jgi:hypothetical protein
MKKECYKRKKEMWDNEWPTLKAKGQLDLCPLAMRRSPLVLMHRIHIEMKGLNPSKKRKNKVLET